MDKHRIEFICDSMFGKLVKWLRMAGYSAVYIKNNERKSFFENFYLKENQFFITSDTKILKKDLKIFYLTEENVFCQFKILKEKFKLNFENAFTVCMECNFYLHKVNKEDVKEKIPEYVFKKFNEFFKCEKCKRIYWRGSHFNMMQKKIKEL